MDILQNVCLAPYTTFGIGGPADYFCVAKSKEDIIHAIQWAVTSRPDPLQIFILGLGANILVGDHGFRGLVIKNECKQYQISSKYNAGMFLTAGSGMTIEELIKITQEQGFSGLEHFAGIPSTLGGALWQNLHFLGTERKSTVFIGDIVESAEIIRVKGIGERVKNSEGKKLYPLPFTLNPKKVNRGYFHFSYDYSSLHDTHDIVLSAVLRLTNDHPETIQQRIFANLAWRKEKHPEYAWRSSAGSVFKKIERYGAGRLIEQVGLKGHRIGGAKISEKHANFIVNTGNATASDIRALIQLAQKKVKEKFNLDLQTEISFIGEF